MGAKAASKAEAEAQRLAKVAVKAAAQAAAGRAKEASRAAKTAEAVQHKRSAAAEAVAEAAETEQRRRKAKEEAVEMAVCGICFEVDSTTDNQIVLCGGDGCNVAVHQECYGTGSLGDEGLH